MLVVPRLTGEPGGQLTFDQILMVADGDKISVGQPYVKGASLTVEVVEHFRGPKAPHLQVQAPARIPAPPGHRDELHALRVTAITA